MFYFSRGFFVWETFSLAHLANYEQHNKLVKTKKLVRQGQDVLNS